MRKEALAIEPIEDIQRVVLARILDPEKGMPAEARAVLRTKLSMGPEEAAPAPASPTNSVPQKVSSQ
jgi:hypothetical protein